MSAKFSFDEKLDISFIPFMPATEQDDVELRLQIRKLQENALLDLSVSIDGEIVYNVSNKETGNFYFVKFTKKYAAGKHEVCVCYKAADEENFTCEKLNFFIEKERKPILQGGFIMLGPPNDRMPCSSFTADTKKMSESDWQRYMDALNDFGQKCVIITTTIQLLTMDGENVAHYPSNLYPRSDILAEDPIRAILTAAERNGQYVLIGLRHPYYDDPLPNTPEVMEELYAFYGDSPAFYGWYESEEINMKRYQPEIWERWTYLRSVANKLCPVKPLLISPYVDGPTAYAETGSINPDFLQKISEGIAQFDIIAPQDMVGHTIDGGRLTVKQTSAMFSTLSKVCVQAGKHLWGNCEAFDFTDDFVLVPRFNGGGMDGENGYIQQIQAACPHVEKVITFMLNGFFTPTGFTPKIGGDAAVKQYEDYLAYRNQIK